MILRLLRFTADLSNEPKGNYTNCLFTADKKYPPATMRPQRIINRRPEYIRICLNVFKFIYFYTMQPVNTRKLFMILTRVG